MLFSELVYIVSKTISRCVMSYKEEAEKRNMHKGTFIIKVRNNTKDTWQGELVWADANRTEKFRSALELFELINEALNLPVVTQ